MRRRRKARGGGKGKRSERARIKERGRTDQWRGPGEGGRKFRDGEGDRGLVWRSAGRTRNGHVVSRLESEGRVSLRQGRGSSKIQEHRQRHGSVTVPKREPLAAQITICDRPSPPPCSRRGLVSAVGCTFNFPSDRPIVSLLPVVVSRRRRRRLQWPSSQLSTLARRSQAVVLRRIRTSSSSPATPAVLAR